MEAPRELPTPPAGVCGYEWPRDCDRVQLATDRPIRQSCCFRPTVADADRCRWHAPPETIPDNLTAALAEVSVSPAIRSQTDSVVQLLDGASLHGCTLGEKVLLRATALSGANLREADLSGADLTDAGLGAARLNDADLSGATLHNAGLSKADLRGADLSDADLTDSLLWRTDLREADLSGADLSDAFLWGAELTNADLTGTILTDADFEDADLTGTDLDQAILWASQ